MTTNKLPKSAWYDFEAAGSHLQPYSQNSESLNNESLSTGYMTYDNGKQTGFASNDASYERELSEAMAAAIVSAKLNQNSPASGAPYVEQPIKVDNRYKKSNNVAKFTQAAINCESLQSQQSLTEAENSGGDYSFSIHRSDDDSNEQQGAPLQPLPKQQPLKTAAIKQNSKVSERIFMTSLLKHTGIALAIIIPLAAFSAYAAPVNMTKMLDTATPNTATIATQPSNIIYKSATEPTTVDSVDLQQYAGTWYEIGRLPMYFQRNCASDVTATYTSKTDGMGIIVTNKCQDDAGSMIVADGLAKPADNTGSKLKVTFLPSWIRWLPVGRADYWVLARDADYQTALVGTPDKKYLWLLARTPNISQQTYSKYRQIAQQQGYDLKEFTLTAQTGQSVKLVP